MPRTTDTLILAAAESLTPTIHMNGDTAKTLEETWEIFHDGIRSLEFPEVNARNYYVRSDSAYDAAHTAMQAIRKKIADIESIALQVRLNIQDQTS